MTLAADLDNWVSDGAGTIGAEHFAAINESSNALYTQWGVEVGLARRHTLRPALLDVGTSMVVTVECQL